MTNPYYINSFAGVSGQTARSEDVNNQCSGVQSGFDGVNSDVARAIKGQPTETLNALPIAATRALMWMKFDASGQPILVAAPLNPRGAWAASTLYNVGDAYTAAPNGSLYYVKTQYTSGTTFGSTDTTNTLVIVNLNGLFFANYQIVTGPATVSATAGSSYFLDSSLGNITINLPTGNLGDSPINVTWIAGSLAAGQAQSIVAAAGQYIEGNTQNTLNIDTSPASITLAYCNSTHGWKLRTMG